MKTFTLLLTAILLLSIVPAALATAPTTQTSDAHQTYLGPPVSTNSITDTLTEGQTKTYAIQGVEYEVTNIFVTDPVPSSGTVDGSVPTVKFSINGDVTNTLRVGQSQTLADGTVVTVKNIDNEAAFVLSRGDGRVTSSLRLKETKTFFLEGKEYEVSNLFMVEPTSPAMTTFTINGERTKTLRVGQSQTLADGTVVTLRHIDDEAAFELRRGNARITSSLKKGATKTYTLQGREYEVSNVFMVAPTSPAMTTLTINGERASSLQVDQSYTFSNGARLTIIAIDASQHRGSTTFNLAGRPTAQPPDYPPSPSVSANSITDALAEGQTKTYTIGGKEFEVKLLFLATDGRAKFQVNGQRTPGLSAGRSSHVGCALITSQGVNALTSQGVSTQTVRFTLQRAECLPTPSPTKNIVDTVKEGEQRTYVLDGHKYDVTLVFASVRGDVKFMINKVVLKSLRTGESQQFGQITLLIQEVLVNDRDAMVTFRLSPTSSVPPTSVSDFRIVLDAHGSSTVTMTGIDISAALQQDEQSGTPISVGSTLLDTTAYRTLSDNDLQQNLIIVLADQRALLMDMNPSDRRLMIVENVLRKRGFQFVFMTHPRREWLLAKNMVKEFFPTSDADGRKNANACTMEAKICPDGSVVGRTGPDCAFAPCPQTSDKSMTLREGATQTYTLKGEEYEVTNLFVTNPVPQGMERPTTPPETKFSINGEMSRALREGATYTFKNGVGLHILSIDASSKQGIVTFALEGHATKAGACNTMEGSGAICDFGSADFRGAFVPGETKSITINGEAYEVTLLSLSKDPCGFYEAKFSVNGQLGQSAGYCSGSSFTLRGRTA